MKKRPPTPAPAVPARHIESAALQIVRQQGVGQAAQWLMNLPPQAGSPAIDPARVLFDLASSLRLQDPGVALQLAERAVEIDPDLMGAWLLSATLNTVLGRRQRTRDALLRILQSALATPAQILTAASYLVRDKAESENTIEAARNAFFQLNRPLRWASTLLDICLKTADWPTADELILQISKAYRDDPLFKGGENPRTHLLWCGDEAVNLRVLGNWSANRFKLPARTSAAAPEPLQGRRLKVGYLSGDIRDHPTARLVNGLFRHHDREKVEMFLYCSGWDDGSGLRREVISHFEHMHRVASLSDEAGADLIRQHGIDVLVELNGPTTANRMGILAHRPAPVQIGYLGWPGSVGGRVVDYIVGDPYTIPPGAEALYPEKVIRLHETYQVNDYASQQLLPAPSRADVGLPDGRVQIIGMFNAINKVRGEVWAVWMRILRAAPNALLWILDPGLTARRNIVKATLALGVDPRRILAAPRTDQEAHLARLQCCDLMLDPWPYGGHTSTSDALFAGVPVLTLEGENFAGRVSGGLLKAARCEALVQPSIEAYVNTAVTLLHAPEELKRIKAFIKGKIAATGIFDAGSKARQLESAYLACAERAWAGLPAAHIDVRMEVPASSATAAS